MAFRRYDGFVAKVPQKKMDNGLPKCPFCGEHPHWLLDLHSGFKSTMTCMCEKCGGKLYSENHGFSFDDNMLIVDVGSKNLNNLPLNSTYHIKSLNTIAQNTFCNENPSYYSPNDGFKTIPNTTYTPTYTPPYTEQKNKKNIAAITGISIISFILFFSIMLWILLPGGGSDSSKLEPVQKSSMKVEEIAGYYYVTITGSAKNTTNRTMSYVSISFTLYDAAGNVVGTAIANQAGLNAGKTWAYSATGISTTSKPVSWESTDVTILYD